MRYEITDHASAFWNACAILRHGRKLSFFDQVWPDLPYAAWKDTCATLQLWTQVVGKIRLAQTPWLNHSWHVPLYLTARGLTTSPIPHHGGMFEIEFDFIAHALASRRATGAAEACRCGRNRSRRFMPL